MDIAWSIVHLDWSTKGFEVDSEQGDVYCPQGNFKAQYNQWIKINCVVTLEMLLLLHTKSRECQNSPHQAHW